MSQLEALRTQLDTLQIEAGRLEAQNARLRDENPEMAAVLDGDAELERQRLEMATLAVERDELRRQLHESQEKEVSLSEAKGALEERVSQLQSDIQEAVVDREFDADSELARLKAANEALELRCSRQTEGLERAEERAELELLRAVDGERRKWEEREQRLLEQVKELRVGSESATSPPTHIVDTGKDSATVGSEAVHSAEGVKHPPAKTPETASLQTALSTALLAQ